jgi:hypothetical protein
MVTPVTPAASAISFSFRLKTVGCFIKKPIEIQELVKKIRKELEH